MATSSDGGTTTAIQLHLPDNITAKRLRKIYDRTGKRRGILFRRCEPGRFGFEEQHFSEHPQERCWIPVGEKTAGLYDSEERAESEARANVDWLITEAASTD